VKLAVLVDRGHRELPIAADFAGRTILTDKSDMVKVVIAEDDTGEDMVQVIPGKGFES
jgi:pyrimidine operon attenuation protein/uracil phosphoribosyltransferase